MPLIQSRPLFTGAVVICAVGGATIYGVKTYLDRCCPRVPLQKVPASSACRHLIESANTYCNGNPWGMEKASLLSPWGSGGHDRWTSSFAALQVEIPSSIVAAYRGAPNDAADTHHLMQNLVIAFLKARAKGPEGWLLDKNVPSISFEPGTHLFGEKDGIAAFLLDTWSSAHARSVNPQALPSIAVKPVSDFPSNQSVVLKGDADSAGAVMFWQFPVILVASMNQAASRGVPWRLMPGGYQEWIVEKISDEVLRVTYVMVECSYFRKAGQSKSDFKLVPRLGYEAHVLYAQCLLYRAIKEMEQAMLPS